ncbi:MAG: environmental stress-induced protein Ves [Parasphingorhabdus sp.]|jgi:environmental stress-induced protein Ves
MTNWTLLGPDDFARMPWRNGLGHTIEILKEDMPDNSGFAWRLSMADVVSDGEFSNFAGYDRTLLLLEGQGITLTYDGNRSDSLQSLLQAAQFSGDEHTASTLHNGPIRDFNIMTRRGVCSATVLCSPNSETLHVGSGADISLIYAPLGNVDVVLIDNSTKVLLAHHLLVSRDQNTTATCLNAPAITVGINYV